MGWSWDDHQWVSGIKQTMWQISYVVTTLWPHLWKQGGICFLERSVDSADCTLPRPSRKPFRLFGSGRLSTRMMIVLWPFEDWRVGIFSFKSHRVVAIVSSKGVSLDVSIRRVNSRQLLRFHVSEVAHSSRRGFSWNGENERKSERFWKCLSMSLSYSVNFRNTGHIWTPWTPTYKLTSASTFNPVILMIWLSFWLYKFLVPYSAQPQSVHLNTCGSDISDVFQGSALCLGSRRGPMGRGTGFVGLAGDRFGYQPVWLSKMAIKQYGFSPMHVETATSAPNVCDQIDG